MRVILIGGGETLETIYFLARIFVRKGYQTTVVDQDPDEAKMLSQRVEATVILGDGSDPAVLDQAGARRADVVLSLTQYDADNLVACQLAQQMYGVPRTMALVSDPDNEEIFRQLGISMVFSPAKIIGTLIEGQTACEDIANQTMVAGGRVQVTEVMLREGAPAVGKTFPELPMPNDSLIANVLRNGEVLMPREVDHIRVGDRIILISVPESQADAIEVLTGESG
ncbi:MAG: TrkA family potassium uptake protein [Chloroflexi bacterium]|nr:TrkA family potassium uptake protein [Chloroflexota bacterium]